ncbi:mitochondrial inner membrane protein Mitofilin [Apiosordaria backusii]|uniref:MICOS complex subunit MIC60 n=1 Tax=Apiosordaria backusii TaxID=314023 RepID=A0AA40EBV6_9PEZI|nr:mitochondrial inner membrane protein Mitofilin [Apiosordaria backusii]
MLRTSIRSVRALGNRPAAAVAGRQWQASAARRAVVSGQRFYADDKKHLADEAKLPAETLTAPTTPPPPPPQTTPAATITPEQAPLTPPAPGPAVVPPPPPPPAPPVVPKKKGFFRRLRNLLLRLVLLGVLGFGGGVWYSRINDNFHDFFTQYVPYGEEAVLYLEELDFRKRFPNVANRVTGRKAETASEQVNIPAQSGASWRVADGDHAGRQSSGVTQKVVAAKDAVKETVKDIVKPEPATVTKAKNETAALPKVEAKDAALETKAKGVPTPVEEKKEVAVVPASASSAETKEFRAPDVNEPSVWPPASPIDPLSVPHADDPIVQQLVHMLNDIITVINYDGAADKYSQTIWKAKDEVSKVGDRILSIKSAAEEEAAKQVKARIDSFDKHANELVSRLEAIILAQEQQWRHEFEAEVERLKHSYDDKIKLIQEREQKLSEQKLQNKLLEQAVELQRQFSRDIKKHVEEERNGRLGRLESLSKAVSELEKLTAGLNEVVDTNLRTQQLHVAVEAVRASLEDAHHPRPFIKELVALKEIAADDPVVDAAIASIHPSAYQRGIPTSAELIDRFRRVAAEVRKASLLPEDAGVASHASSYLLSKVMFKKQGLAAGDDVESILTRTQTFLEEGDLDNAAREMNTLGGWAKTLSRDWLSEVRKVLEVQQALDVITTEARLQSLKVE